MYMYIYIIFKEFAMFQDIIPVVISKDSSIYIGLHKIQKNA